MAPYYAKVARGPEPSGCNWLHAEDGVRIRVAHWNPEGARGTVLLFPGRSEHIEKYGMDCALLTEGGYAVTVIDWRGQGIADRLTKTRYIGHVERFSDYQKDVQALLRHAAELDLPRPYYLLAHSMGGAIGLRALHEGLPVKAVSFSAPMWGIAMSPLLHLVAKSATQLGINLGYAQALIPGREQSSYFLRGLRNENTLTNDPEMWDYMAEQVKAHPEFGMGGPSFRWLHEALIECDALRSGPPAKQPCIAFLGDQESIVDPAAIREVMARWENGKLVELGRAQHEILMERPEIRLRAFQETLALFDAHP